MRKIMLVAAIAGTGAVLYALELVPRTSRAQSMDVLSSQAAVAGYKASFGSDGPPGSYEDLALADVLVLWGATIADKVTVDAG